MFDKIDAYVLKRKSDQAKRQMKRPIVGTSSTRPKPTDNDLPSFSISD